jgi:eukaryotic-like serine/threonine-protein kinase
MAAGRLPFSGRSSAEVTSAILRDPAPPLPDHVPASLRAVIERCLAKEPGQRYRSAAEVRAALEVIGSDARVTTAVSQARPGGRRSRLGVGIAGAAVVLALVGVVWAARARTPVPSASSTRPTPTAPRLASGVLASTAPEANEYYERYQLIAMSRLDLPEMRRML